MSSIDRLLGVAAMGSTLANASSGISANVALLQRFLSGATAVVALAAACATMAGMIVIVAFYALYLGLLRYGLDPQVAFLLVMGLAVAATAALGGLAALRWRQLREIPRLARIEPPGLSQAGRIADAFLDGFLSRNRD